MSTVTEQDWHGTAREMFEAGVSQRQIAEELGQARSTIGDYLRSLNGAHREELDEQAEPGEQTGPLQDQIAGQRDVFGGEVESMPPQEIVLEGSQQRSIDFGGKVPTTTTITIKGTARVRGSYRKGDVFTGQFEARVDGVASKDRLDKDTKQVVEAVESFTAVLLDVVVDGS